MRRREIDMCQGPLLPSVLRYTIPVILTSVLQLLFSAADLIVVGRFCGMVSVAAVGATTSLSHLTINLFLGLSVGAGVLVAQCIGARDEEGQSRAVHAAVLLSLVSGAILTAVGVPCSSIFLRWMGTPADVIGLSSVYMRIYFGGITASMLYNFGAAVLRAAGDTRSPLVYLTLAGVVNVILNVIFVRALHLDVAGVALATFLSQVLSAALVLRALMRRQDACRFSWRQMRLDGSMIRRIVGIGLPAGLQSSQVSIANVLIQSSINSFGSTLVSANSAAASLEGFVLVSMNAFHQAAMNFAGQNVGALRYDRIRRIAGICYACVAVAGLVLGIGMYCCGRPLLRLYITDSEEAVMLGLRRMAFIVLPYFLDGLMEVTTGIIRGMGYSTTPMVISVLGICVFRVAWIKTVFLEFRRPETLYVSYPISWTLTLLALLCAFFFLYRKLLKRQEKAAAAVK